MHNSDPKLWTMRDSSKQILEPHVKETYQIYFPYDGIILAIELQNYATLSLIFTTSENFLSPLKWELSSVTLLLQKH